MRLFRRRDYEGNSDSIFSKTSLLSEFFFLLSFICTAIVGVFSPWAFSSWEAWWFWPMNIFVFASALFAGLGVFVATVSNSVSNDGLPTKGHFVLDKKLSVLIISVIPFLLYLFLRSSFSFGSDKPIVFMDMQKSLMIYVSPVILFFSMLLSCTKSRLKWLCFIMVVNSVIVGCVGFYNNYMFDDNRVLWYPWGLYFNRAKGPFFCPNHLSAFLNCSIAYCVAIFMLPRSKLWEKIFGALSFILLLIANVATASRGGVLSLVIMLLIELSFFMYLGRKKIYRVVALSSGVVIALVVGLLVFNTDNYLSKRTKQHPLYKTIFSNDDGEKSKMEKLHDTFWYSFDRGTYIGSALRAWRSNPIWGIGPGQHSSRWEEFSATDDGSIDPLKYPRLRNDTYHLYEVHSDWTQLLEELGVVGVILFAAPMCVLFGILGINNRRSLHLLITKKHRIKHYKDDSEWRVRQRNMQKREDFSKAEIVLQEGEDELDAELRMLEEMLEREKAKKNTSGVHKKIKTRKRYHHHEESNENTDKGEDARIPHLLAILPLAALMMCVALFFHSFGDFSLQIPSIVWCLSIFVIAGILVHTEESSDD